MLTERSMVMAPEASANRPVPPVMVWVSVIVTVGNTTMSPCPTTLTRSWSPFAAVQMAVPVADHGEVGTESESSEVRGAARAVEMPEGARVAMACLSAAEATRMKSVVRRRGDAPSDDRWGKEAAANAEVHHADPSDTGPSMASALHRF